jgi:hypothetical protein
LRPAAAAGALRTAVLMIWGMLNIKEAVGISYCRWEKGRRFAGLRAEQAGSYTKGQKEAVARQYTGMMKREGEREAGEGGNGAGSSTSYPRPGIWRETRESAVWKGRLGRGNWAAGRRSLTVGSWAAAWQRDQHTLFNSGWENSVAVGQSARARVGVLGTR